MAEEGEKKPGLLMRIADSAFGKLIFGFLLTGVIGQSLSWAHAERREAEALRRAALESIRDFSMLEEALRKRARQLGDTIRHQAPPERIAAHAKIYHDASVAWIQGLDANNLRIREYFGFTDVNFIEAAAEDGLAPSLLEVDDCLTRAELTVARGEPDAAIAIIDNCGEQSLDALLSDAHDCSYQFAGTMTRFVMTGLQCSDAQWRDDGRKVYEHLMQACGVEPDPMSTFWFYGNNSDFNYDQSCVRDDSLLDRIRS